MGDLSKLYTTEKTSIVNSINELYRIATGIIPGPIIPDTNGRIKPNYERTQIDFVKPAGTLDYKFLKNFNEFEHGFDSRLKWTHVIPSRFNFNIRDRVQVIDGDITFSGTERNCVALLAAEKKITLICNEGTFTIDPYVIVKIQSDNSGATRVYEAYKSPFFYIKQ